MSALQVTTIIYRGLLKKLNPEHEGFYHSKPNSMGLLPFTIDNYQCPRCQKSDGYVYEDKNKNENSYFCGTESCIIDDASYGRKKKEEVEPNIFRRG